MRRVATTSVGAITGSSRPATVSSYVAASRSWNSYTRPVPVSVNTVLSRDSAVILRLASASFSSATTRVGPLSRMRFTSPITVEGTEAERKSACSPTLGSPRSSKPQAARRRQAATRILDNDVHQPAGHDDDLLDLLPGDEL